MRLILKDLSVMESGAPSERATVAHSLASTTWGGGSGSGGNARGASAYAGW